MREKNCNFLISAMTGTLVAAAFRYITFKYPTSPVGIETLGNIKAYLILAVLWLGIFFGLDILLEKILKCDIPKFLAYVITFIEGSACAYISIRLYNILGRGRNPKYVVLGAVFILGIVFCASFGKGRFISKFFRRSKSLFLWLETGALAVIWYLTSATVNTFEHYSFGRSYNIYHSAAYLDSILNTYYGVPFTGLESELYGHYSIIMLPFMKLFGMNTNTIGIMLGLLTAACFILLCACIMMSTDSFILKVFGIGGLGIYGVTAYSIYWQSFPHRMIFPSLVIFVLTFAAFRKKFGPKLFYIGLLIPTLALIWNTESGAVVMVAWALCGAESIFSKLPKLARFFISLLISVAASVTGALIVVNIYNRVCGGAWIGPKELIGFQATGFVGHISKGLDSGNALHVHIFAMLFICAVYGIRELYIRKNTSVKATFAIAVAAIGLGIGTYYINNPSGGEGILSMYFMLASVIVLSCAKISRDPYNLAKTCLAIYAAMALFCGGINGRELIPQVGSHKSAYAYDYSKFRSFCKDLDSRVAPDTVGGGFGTTQVFMELGRDRVGRDFHFRMEELGEPEHFIKFCDGNDSFEGYEVKDQIFYEDVAFNYYEKIH